MTQPPDLWAIAEAQTDDGRPPSALIDAYAEGPRTLLESVAGMDADQLLARPVEGRWSTLEVLCHVCDAEQFMADRIKRTVATNHPLLVGVDGIRYLEALHYQERDPELELALVELTRAQMAADLRRVSDDAWARTAVHTATGLVTARQLLMHAVNHLERHVAAIREKRRALGLD